VIDVGNTNARAALFRGETLVAVVTARRPARPGVSFWKGQLRPVLALAQLWSRPDGAVICSVVPAETKAAAAAVKSAAKLRPVIVRPDGSSTGPMPTRYRDPSRLGPDRYCAALAARTRGRPAIAVSVGTAITIDYVSARGTHEGGVILPGLRTSAAALKSSTALLPDAGTAMARKSARSGNYPARETEAAIAQGIVIGAAGAISEHIDRMIKVGGSPLPGRRRGAGGRTVARKKPLVVGTGGDAEALPGKLFDRIDPALVLKGALMYFLHYRPRR
jgi:type III pantothenate kinase